MVDNMEQVTVFTGMLVDSRLDWSLRVEFGVLVVQGERIVCRADLSRLEEVLEKFSVGEEEVIRLANHQFLMPGLIDTHIHASQYPNAGIALDLTLLDWLQRYTFPTEEGLGDTNLARHVYTRCVQSTLSSGTTTAVYFATIHKNSTAVLATVCIEEGQRALVGKVSMDRNSPPTYREDTDDCLASARSTVESIESLGSSLVEAIVTPRFVPSCSRGLMKGLGRLSSERSLKIQTHLAENVGECKWVKELEPDCDSYTQVYEKTGLLGENTILAHCVHLSDKEVDILHKTKSGVSHCPNSNFSLKSGVCDVLRLKKAGVKVGLGTDCSGGYSPSMLNAMRMSVLASNTASLSGEEQPLLFSDAVFLATRGGASLLGREDDLASLDEGKLADLIVVDLSVHQSTSVFGHESNTDLVSKFVFLGDDRNVVQVWVNGRKVKDLMTKL